MVVKGARHAPDGGGGGVFSRSVTESWTGGLGWAGGRVDRKGNEKAVGRGKTDEARHEEKRDMERI